MLAHQIMASALTLWGHPCGEAFVADDFLKADPEYVYQKEFLRDMPGQVWMVFGTARK
jgi:hypothetical protein